jgi:hypothetical protein
MKTLSILALATAVSAALAGAPVAAQEHFAPEQRSLSPTPQLHAVNPSLSLSAPANSPLQEQMREDYATGLMGPARIVATKPIGPRPTGAGDRPRAKRLYSEVAGMSQDLFAAL